MADNYLERKMAERAAGRAGKPATGLRRGVLAVPFAPQRIALTGHEAPVVDTLLTLLRSTGSVAEYCPDTAALDALRTRLGALDVTITVTAPDSIEIHSAAGVRAISSPDATALGRLAAFLASPANRSVDFVMW